MVSLESLMITLTIHLKEDLDLHNNEEGKDELQLVRLLLSKQKLLSL